MSEYMDMLIKLLPEHSALHDKSNPLRKILDRGVGSWFDNMEDIFPELFVTDAHGGWLDAHGRDYGVTRRLHESDEDYRKRIIYKKLDYLTVPNLREIFGLTLYTYVENYNSLQNDLTSDNPYLSGKYMANADEELQEILENKFVLDSGVEWL